jgi:putative redox protein
MNHFELKWLENFNFVGKTPSNNSIVLDSWGDNDETPSAPTPMELMIIALAGCTAMDMISILRKMRKEIETFKIELDAEKANEHPKVWTEVKMKYILKGIDLDQESITKAIELSQTKYCSVSAMFQRSGVKIDYSFEILN